MSGLGPCSSQSMTKEPWTHSCHSAGTDKRPADVTTQSSQTSRHPNDTGKSLPCFKHGCAYRGHAMSLVLRHAKTVHKLNYCRDCCVFYGDTKSKFCPDCQRFCMSPTCFQAAPTGTTGALSQRHTRTSHCPTAWGRTSGVPDEQLLDYLRQLDLDRQSSGDRSSSEQPGDTTKSPANNSSGSLNRMSDLRRTDHGETTFPLDQHNTGVSQTSSLAFCPTQPRNNFAPNAENFHPGMTQTANLESESSSNAQSAPAIDFDFLGGEPAVWVWDGIVR